MGYDLKQNKTLEHKSIKIAGPYEWHISHLEQQKMKLVYLTPTHYHITMSALDPRPRLFPARFVKKYQRNFGIDFWGVVVLIAQKYMIWGDLKVYASRHVCVNGGISDPIKFAQSAIEDPQLVLAK